MFQLKSISTGRRGVCFLNHRFLCIHYFVYDALRIIIVLGVAFPSGGETLLLILIPFIWVLGHELQSLWRVVLPPLLAIEQQYIINSDSSVLF